MDFFYKLKNLFQRLVRLIQYISVIWSTNDWDYGYSIKIFRYSLNRLKKDIETFPYTKDSAKKRDINRLDKAMAALERLENDNMYEEIAGFPKFHSEFRRTSTGNYVLYDKSPLTSDEKKALIRNAMKKAKEMRKRDCIYLTKVLYLYMTRWWT